MKDPGEPRSPFAALLQHYMWEVRRPPINPNRLAVELGVNRQTIVNWLSGKKPLPDMLPLVAEKTQIPLATLYEAAGYPVPDDDIVERLIRMAPDERQRILERMDSMLERSNHVLGEERPKALAGER